MGKYDWLYGMIEGETVWKINPTDISVQKYAKRIRQRITKNGLQKEFSVILHPDTGVLVHRKRK